MKPLTRVGCRIAASACLCAFTAFVSVVFVRANDSGLAMVSVETETLGRRIPADFVGFSLEVSTAGQGLPNGPKSAASSTAETGPPEYALGSPGAPNRVFFRLMRNLGHGVLRLGGNSQDNTCWNPSAAPHPDWCKGKLTPADFRLYSDAAKATDWRLILGINLKQNSSRWALNEIKQAIAKTIGPEEVAGLEMGNESDLFNQGGFRPPTYSIADFVKDFSLYATTFRENPVAKR